MTTRVERYTGPRTELRALFAMAESSSLQLESYLDEGEVLVALRDGRVIGHLQLVDRDDPRQSEVKNMAVEPEHRGSGVGRRLVEAAIELAKAKGRTTVVVATAAADVGNLRFYQRTGFRMLSIERDAFTPATGYSRQASIVGIELRDRVWLERELDPRT